MIVECEQCGESFDTDANGIERTVEGFIICPHCNAAQTELDEDAEDASDASDDAE